MASETRSPGNRAPAGPVDDRLDLGNALRIMDIKRPAPLATCPTCHEPLVMTMEFRGAEFICVPCDRLYGYLSPRPAESTPELEARHEELKQQYDAARAARKVAAEAEMRAAQDAR